MLEGRIKVAEAGALLKSIELQLEEIRLTGREPRNTSHCEDLDKGCLEQDGAPIPVSGPCVSEFEGCMGKAAEAMGTTLVYAGTSIAALDATLTVWAAGAAMSFAAALSWGLLIAGVGVLAIYYTSEFVKCKRNR